MLQVHNVKQRHISETKIILTMITIDVSCFFIYLLFFFFYNFAFTSDNHCCILLYVIGHQAFHAIHRKFEQQSINTFQLQ